MLTILASHIKVLIIQRLRITRDGSVRATLSQVNAGIIRRDLLKLGQAREALQKFSTRELIEISAKAGEYFLHANFRLAKALPYKVPMIT